MFKIFTWNVIKNKRGAKNEERVNKRYRKLWAGGSDPGKVNGERGQDCPQNCQHSHQACGATEARAWVTLLPPFQQNGCSRATQGSVQEAGLQSWTAEFIIPVLSLTSYIILAHFLTSMCLSFLLCKEEMIAAASLGHCMDLRIYIHHLHKLIFKVGGQCLKHSATCTCCCYNCYIIVIYFIILLFPLPLSALSRYNGIWILRDTASPISKSDSISENVWIKQMQVLPGQVCFAKKENSFATCKETKSDGKRWDDDLGKQCKFGHTWYAVHFSGSWFHQS